MDYEIAVFAGGCFWCTEAIFKRLKGVMSVTPGYSGGNVPNPTYDQVCSGSTGHAEAIKIEYDPAQISFETLLAVFFSTHDPTTLNRQGADTGTQYRSAVFYSSEQQKKEAVAFVRKLTADEVFDKPVVTEVKALGEFFEADESHRNYYDRNSNKPYCQVVINPKIQKLKEKYAHLLK